MTDSGVERDGAGDATSFSLIDRVRHCDGAAWVRLVALYGPVVYRWCIRAGLQPTDAADVGQEVFAAVARAVGSFHHDRAGDSFRGWLFTITRNKLRDRAGAVAPVAEGGSSANHRLAQLRDDAAADPDASSCRDDRGFLVRRAVELIRAEFEPKTWEAFWRSAVDGQPAADVAAELGMTPNAVYLAKARVRRRLFAEFGGLIALPPRGRANPGPGPAAGAGDPGEG